MELREGWKKNGLPDGRRDLRPPAELDLETPFRQSRLLLTALWSGLISLLQASVAALLGWLGRLLWGSPLSLRGRVCFVTGSGRGLGREICLALAREGAVLACADINPETNRETARLVEEMGGLARAYRLNVADKDEVEDVVSRVEKELGPVYLVVNNAALVLPQLEPTEAFLEASFNVNLFGPYRICKAFLKLMKKRNEGHLINICSAASLCPFPALEIYSMTKAALRSLSLSLSLGLQTESSQVRVSAVMPSIMNSSQDYISMFKADIDMFVSMRQVVEDLMELVHWGGVEVTSPHFLRPLLILSQLLPSKSIFYFTKRLNLRIVYPTAEEYEGLAPGQIVRECSGKRSIKKEESPKIYTGNGKKD